MRVSEKQRYQATSKRIERAKENNLDALSQLSSQKRLNSLSDDPVGAANVVKHRSRIAELESFERNVIFAKGFVDVTESAIQSIQERLGRAHELAVGMASDSYGPDSRNATAREIGQIIDQIIKTANQKYNSRYVFSGFRTKSPSLDTDGVFLGDDGAIFLQLEQGNFTRINADGRSLFEASEKERKLGHHNMIDVLRLLQDGLREDDKHLLYTAVSELEFQINKATSVQASVGAVHSALQVSEEQLEFSKEKEKISKSLVEDADIYQATSDFKRTESVLQSTLLASNKLLQPSLLNFMQ